MNILRFQTNTPTEVALNSPQGTIVEGRYGERVLFHLTDGRVMYVPPIVARKIEDQGIAPGEPFELCKTQVKNGRLRSIEWWLRRTHAEPSDGENADIPAQSPSNLGSQLVQSIAAVNGANGNHPFPPPESHAQPNRSAKGENAHRPAEPSSDLESQLVQSIAAVNGTNGNGRLPAAAQDEAPQNGSHQTSSVPPVPVTKLEHALKTAISAAHNAEKYGTDLGYVVRFDADAIKSMAITVLINMREGAQR